MRKVTIPLPVWVVEESDIAGIDDQARVDGALQSSADAIAEVLPGNRPVRMQLYHRPRGDGVRVVVSQTKFEVGEGIVLHPAFPGGIGKFTAELLLVDEDDSKIIDDIRDAAMPDDSADLVTSAEVDTPKEPVKKAAKKSTRKATKKG